MNTKKMKIAMTENWKAIDKILMEDVIPRSVMTEEDYLNYNTNKSSLLQIACELYHLLGVNFNYVATEGKLSVAMEKACAAKEYAVKIAESNKGKKTINKAIFEESNRRNENIRVVSDMVTLENYKKLAIDNLLICMPFTESSNLNSKKLNSFEEEYLRESYKIIRDTLVEMTSKYDRLS